MGKSHAASFYTLKELDKAGYKVHGATGTSMLRSLEVRNGKSQSYEPVSNVISPAPFLCARSS